MCGPVHHLQLDLRRGSSSWSALDVLFRDPGAESAAHGHLPGKVVEEHPVDLASTSAALRRPGAHVGGARRARNLVRRDLAHAGAVARRHAVRRREEGAPLGGDDAVAGEDGRHRDEHGVSVAAARVGRRVLEVVRAAILFHLRRRWGDTAV